MPGPWVGHAYQIWMTFSCIEFGYDSLQNKCRTADPDRQNLGRSGKLSFFIIYKFWQNCASVRQVSDLILKTAMKYDIHEYILHNDAYLSSDFHNMLSDDT